MIEHIVGDRIANDSNIYIIEMFIAIQQGWIPPIYISKDLYLFCKDNKDFDKKLTGYVGIAASYGNCWFGGYVHKNKDDYDYQKAAFNSIIKGSQKI